MVHLMRLEVRCVLRYCRILFCDLVDTFVTLQTLRTHKSCDLLTKISHWLNHMCYYAIFHKDVSEHAFRVGMIA
jgi:hypothetical protein